MSLHPTVRRVVAPNADAWTLTGTNTWLVQDPASREVVLVDPGPRSTAHLEAIRQSLEETGGTLTTVVLTHFHDDHTGALDGLLDRWPVVVRAVDPAWCREGSAVTDGEVVGRGDAALTCLITPGHTFDSMCLHSPAASAILTGDMVLGGASTMIDYPDGSLTSYFESMKRLETMARDLQVAQLLPGHGDVLDEAPSALSRDIAQRRERLEQVRGARASVAGSTDSVVDLLYPDLDSSLRTGARQNVAAALQLLENEASSGATTTHHQA